MEKFSKLGIKGPLLKAIEEEGFKEPTEIQEKSIPLVLAGKDVMAGSATGSGKTMAFGAAIIHFCQPRKGLQALVLTPTRELAEQVAKALKKFSRHLGLEVAAVYGGVSLEPQVSAIRAADVVVGTPGRLLDHMERRTIFLGNVKVLVLDEADRMLDMGFVDDVEKIIRHCPKERQTLLFSATISYAITHIAKRHMKDPVKVFAESFVDPTKLTQVYYDVDEDMRLSLLIHLLKGEKSGLVMVFCNTRNNADFVANNLELAGIDAMPIHGGLSQDKRNKIMEKFNSGKAYVLVCTDVAGRGLDIKGVSHVYNFDVPNDSKDYVHRIGRTARAGEEGKVVNLLSPKDHQGLLRVIKDTNFEILKEEVPYVKREPIRWRHERRERGPRQGYGRPRPGYGNRSSGNRRRPQRR